MKKLEVLVLDLDYPGEDTQVNLETCRLLGILLNTIFNSSEKKPIQFAKEPIDQMIEEIKLGN